MRGNGASGCDKRNAKKVDYDVIVIGAGVAGLYQLHCMRELGLKVRSYEAGTGVGGAWYWNRYPGARFDSESWTYGYGNKNFYNDISFSSFYFILKFGP